jgi:hypothetical protein
MIPRAAHSLNPISAYIGQRSILPELGRIRAKTVTSSVLVRTALGSRSTRARKTCPFDRLVEGLCIETSRGISTPIELFVEGVATWAGDLRRLFYASERIDLARVQEELKAADACTMAE